MGTSASRIATRAVSYTAYPQFGQKRLSFVDSCPYSLQYLFATTPRSVQRLPPAHHATRGKFHGVSDSTRRAATVIYLRRRKPPATLMKAAH